MPVSQAVLVCLAAAVTAAPQGPEYYQEKPLIKVLAQKFYMDQYGNYDFSYEQDNGQRVSKVADKLLRTYSAYDVNRLAALN